MIGIEELVQKVRISHKQQLHGAGRLSATGGGLLDRHAAVVLVGTATGEEVRFMKLETRQVTKRYGGFLALDGASFQTGAEARVVALLGPSGGGKSNALACAWRSAAAGGW